MGLALRHGVITVTGAAAALVAIASCSLFTSLDDFAATSDGGPTTDGGSLEDRRPILVTAIDAADPDAEAGAVEGCPSRGGPTPVRIDLPDGGWFCVDATEVTRAQYREFLDVGSPTNTHPRCTANTSFVPGQSLDGTPTLPVSGVDWCDAHAFCAWAGKRLCRRVGNGSPLTAGQGGHPTAEIVYACTRGGTRTYPYGTTYTAGACNGADRDAGRPIPVASAAGCEGGFDGLFDLSGNLAEWEDACDATADAGSADMCALHSSNYLEVDPGDLRCTTSRTFPRGSQGSAGFRCCGP